MKISYNWLKQYVDTDLSPEKTGEPWAEGERFFYWGSAQADNALWKDIRNIFETIDRLGGYGWGLWLGQDSIIDEVTANSISDVLSVSIHVADSVSNI